MKRKTTSTGPPLSRPSALVIDADTATRHLLHDLLSPHGYQVDLAADALSGLALYRTYRQDCVLIGTGNAVPDGYEVLCALRDLPGGRGTTIVLLSTQADRSRWLAWDHGPDMYLTKPFSTNQLLDYLRSRSRAHEQNLEHAIQAYSHMPPGSGSSATHAVPATVAHSLTSAWRAPVSTDDSRQRLTTETFRLSR